MSFNLSGTGYEIEMDAEQIDPISYRGNVVITDLNNPNKIFYNNIFLKLKEDCSLEYAYLKTCPNTNYPPFLDIIECLKDNPDLLQAFESHILNMFLHIVIWDYLKQYKNREYDEIMMQLYQFMQNNWEILNREVPNA